MFALKLIQVGNSVGVVLSKELLGLLQVEAGREIMQSHSAVLHELAK